MFRKFGHDDPANQAYLRFSGDGIADLIIGGAFIGIGLMLISELPYVPVWLIIFLMPISWALKKWITVPRLSEAEAAVQAKSGLPRHKILWVTLTGVLVLMVTILATAWYPQWASGVLAHLLSWSMIAASLAIVLLSVGLIYHAWRFVFYALMVIPAMALVTSGVIDFPAALAGLGALMFLGGIVMAGRFVTNHPRLAS